MKSLKSIVQESILSLPIAAMAAFYTPPALAQTHDGGTANAAAAPAEIQPGYVVVLADGSKKGKASSSTHPETSTSSISSTEQATKAKPSAKTLSTTFDCEKYVKDAVAADAAGNGDHNLTAIELANHLYILGKGSSHRVRSAARRLGLDALKFTAYTKKHSEEVICPNLPVKSSLVPRPRVDCNNQYVQRSDVDHDGVEGQEAVNAAYKGSNARGKRAYPKAKQWAHRNMGLNLDALVTWLNADPQHKNEKLCPAPRPSVPPTHCPPDCESAISRLRSDYDAGQGRERRQDDAIDQVNYTLASHLTQPHQDHDWGFFLTTRLGYVATFAANGTEHSTTAGGRVGYDAGRVSLHLGAGAFGWNRNNWTTSSTRPSNSERTPDGYQVLGEVNETFVHTRQYDSFLEGGLSVDVGEQPDGPVSLEFNVARWYGEEKSQRSWRSEDQSYDVNQDPPVPIGPRHQSSGTDDPVTPNRRTTVVSGGLQLHLPLTDDKKDLITAEVLGGYSLHDNDPVLTTALGYEKKF